MGQNLQVVDHVARSAASAAVAECSFSVSIADPSQPDMSLDVEGRNGPKGGDIFVELDFCHVLSYTLTHVSCACFTGFYGIVLICRDAG